MDDDYGLARSSINLRLEPDLKSSIVHALDPQEPVQILGQVDGMLKVSTTHWQPRVMGYALSSGIVRGTVALPIFPRVDIGGDLAIPSVPPSLPLPAFRRWLQSQEESPWLPAGYADAVLDGKRASVGSLIRNVITRLEQDWDAWIATVESEGRQDTCSLDEWIALIQGGREMWSIRAERIFAEPSRHSPALGWAVPADVLHWTGHVRLNPDEPKYKTWFEVECTKLDRQLKGWYKASLLNEFIVPRPETDLATPANRGKAFDLGRPRLRAPADPEIEEARLLGRPAAQYIDIRRALGWGQVHHNLCGEFCVAALASSDVIPLLASWIPAYSAAKDILAGDAGTSIPDLEAMLDAFGMKYEFYRAEGSLAPVTPTYLRQKLDMGRMAIVFTGVTRAGAVKSHSRIRHWVVVEDILSVGSSGWLRVYNPFPNREEAYRFDEVFDMPARSSIGLWVEPKLPRGTKDSGARRVTGT